MEPKCHRDDVLKICSIFVAMCEEPVKVESNGVSGELPLTVTVQHLRYVFQDRLRYLKSRLLASLSKLPISFT